MLGRQRAPGFLHREVDDRCAGVGQRGIDVAQRDLERAGPHRALNLRIDWRRAVLEGDVHRVVQADHGVVDDEGRCGARRQRRIVAGHLPGHRVQGHGRDPAGGLGHLVGGRVDRFGDARVGRQLVAIMRHAGRVGAQLDRRATAACAVVGRPGHGDAQAGNARAGRREHQLVVGSVVHVVVLGVEHGDVGAAQIAKQVRALARRHVHAIVLEHRVDDLHLVRVAHVDAAAAIGGEGRAADLDGLVLRHAIRLQVQAGTRRGAEQLLGGEEVRVAAGIADTGVRGNLDVARTAGWSGNVEVDIRAAAGIEHGVDRHIPDRGIAADVEVDIGDAAAHHLPLDGDRVPRAQQHAIQFGVRDKIIQFDVGARSADAIDAVHHRIALDPQPVRHARQVAAGWDDGEELDVVVEALLKGAAGEGDARLGIVQRHGRAQDVDQIVDAVHAAADIDADVVLPGGGDGQLDAGIVPQRAAGKVGGGDRRAVASRADRERIARRVGKAAAGDEGQRARLHRAEVGRGGHLDVQHRFEVRQGGGQVRTDIHLVAGRARCHERAGDAAVDQDRLAVGRVTVVERH